MTRDPTVPSLRHEVDRLFDNLVHVAWGTRGGNGPWMPQVDLAEEPDRYRLEFDLPGVRLSDLSITASGRTLRVEGSRERTRKTTSEHHHLVERSCGHFVRTFRLPEDADLESLRASLADGVLTIDIPRHRPGRTP